MQGHPMNLKHFQFAVAAALVLFAASSPVQAQAVNTRIGKIELQAGYPSKASAEKLYDEMDFQRATQAFIWALPAVGFHGLHLAHRNTFGAKDGEVVLYVTLKDKAGMLTPNLTTLYLMTFWNLAEQGPLIVEVPAGATAGGFLDIWQRPITDTGQTGPDRGGRWQIPHRSSHIGHSRSAWLYRAALIEQPGVVCSTRT
jgi:hypothetical protein